MVKVRAECTISLGNYLSLTSEEVEVEVLDKEDGNTFVQISIEDDKGRKAGLIISTNDLKMILEAVEPLGWKQLLEKATQELDESEKAKQKAELVNVLREQGYDQAKIEKILELYGMK